MSRDIVKQADHQLTAGDYGSALELYAKAARAYGEEGFALKAVAILKQMRTIIREHTPHDTALAVETRRALIGLYRQLGLETDARAIEEEA